MTDLNKAELRRLAESASPAIEWYALGDLRYEDNKTGEVHGLHHDDDSFIAAATPAAILSLLDENDQLRAEVEALRKEVKACHLLLRECNEVIAEDGGVYIELRAYLSGELPASELTAILSAGKCGGPACCQLCADEAGEVGNG